MHKNIVVTLMYNKAYLTDALLKGLAKHEKDGIDKVIIVDNGTTEKDSLWQMRQWACCFPFDIQIETLDDNLGFTLGANYGLQVADEDPFENNLVFLISNDVEIRGKFIEQSEQIFNEGKLTLIGNRHVNWDSGWNCFNGKIFDYLEGYFLAATSSGWRHLNYFDPNYAPFDYEDIDLSAKAKEKGFRLVSLNNPFIFHRGGGTLGYNPERQKITERNKEYFRQKWT